MVDINNAILIYECIRIYKFLRIFPKIIRVVRKFVSIRLIRIGVNKKSRPRARQQTTKNRARTKKRPDREKGLSRDRSPRVS